MTEDGNEAANHQAEAASEEATVPASASEAEKQKQDGI